MRGEEYNLKLLFRNSLLYGIFYLFVSSEMFYFSFLYYSIVLYKICLTVSYQTTVEVRYGDMIALCQAADFPSVTSSDSECFVLSTLWSNP